MPDEPVDAPQTDSDAEPKRKRREAPPEAPLKGMGGSRAVAAFIAYRNMGPGRSLAKLAQTWEAEGGRTFELRLKSLERWSADYGWADRAKAWDNEQAEAERIANTEAQRRMDRRQAARESRDARRTSDRLNALIDLDEMEYGVYLRQLEAFTERFDAWRDGGMDGEPPSPPKRPRWNVGAMALVQAHRNSTEIERLARGSATEAVELQTESALPPMIIVNPAHAPPPVPIDPYEDESPVPAAVTAAARAAMPPAIVPVPDIPADPRDDE